MDANAKIEAENNASKNGQLLLNMCKRQNLEILNKSAICRGKITRHRITKVGEEKYVLDYIMVCEILFSHLESMLIDEDRLFTLTKFVSTKGGVDQKKSDHNIMYCNFNLTYSNKIQYKVRREIYNLKNKECQDSFREETENNSKFVDVFETDDSFEKKTAKFRRCLNQSIRKCFRKMRVKNKDKENQSDLSCQLLQWSKLKIILKNSD